MKPKQLVVAIAALVALAAFVFARRTEKPISAEERKATTAFLQQFCKTLQNDGYLIGKEFEKNGLNAKAGPLLKRLSQPELSMSTPLPKISMAYCADSAVVSRAGNDEFKAVIPLKLGFWQDSLHSSASSFVLYLRKEKNDSLKISNIDLQTFVKDYDRYEDVVDRKFYSDPSVYGQLSLAAFRSSKELAARGDTVLYFQHINNKTWFFVKRGEGVPAYERDRYEYYGNQDKKLPSVFKIGLIGPDKQMVIPARFDLLHNIGATFPGWIEAELNGKRGFYDQAGKVVLPVMYDEILPLNSADALAVLRKGSTYYWWNNDRSIKADASIRIADVLPRIKAYHQSYNLSAKNLGQLAEVPDRTQSVGVYFPPSYLVDWNLRDMRELYPDIRKRRLDYLTTYGALGKNNIAFDNEKKEGNWLTTLFYSITQHYLGGRNGFYSHRTAVVADKKDNRIYAAAISGYGNDDDAKTPDHFKVTRLNDGLYEIRFPEDKANPFVSEFSPVDVIGFKYFSVKNGKLVELETNRQFPFTKFVKVNDDYLNLCNTQLSNNQPFVGKMQLLLWIRNEILADNGQPLDDVKWLKQLEYVTGYKEDRKKPQKLSAIDQYNLAFIDKRLAETKPKTLAAK